MLTIRLLNDPLLWDLTSGQRLTALLASLLIPIMTLGQLPQGFTQKKLTQDVINEATSMAHAADGRIFVAERSGSVKVFQNGTLATVHQVQTTTDAEQGLLGITLHPDFASNGKCYLFYTNQQRRRHYLDVISISPSNTVNSVARVMQFDSILNGNHNGGALLFKDGFLYIAIGDSNRPEFAPQLDTYRGKILRLLDNGEPAPTNPYYNEPGASRQRRSIWAVGFRNPWRMSLDPVSKKLFVIDVGERYEEINDITAPSASKNYNYGWNASRLTGSDQAANTIAPFFFYAHENWGCAITTGLFFNPPTTSYPAEYRGRFYFSDWCRGWFRSLGTFVPGEHTNLSETGFSNILGTSVGADGNIYYLNYNTRGSLWRLEYNGTQAPVIVNQPGSSSVVAGDQVSLTVSVSGAAPIFYQWQKNGADISGATGARLTFPKTVAADAGVYRCIVKNSFGTVASASANLTVEAFNAKPVAKILAPSGTLTWNVMDKIQFSGDATDAEDGALPPSAFSWEVRFYHKENANSEHWHSGETLPPGIKSGSFTADSQGEASTDIWFRLILSVKDFDGRIGRDSVDLYPNKVALTAKSNVVGLNVVMGAQGQTPFSRVFVVNSRLMLDAPSAQTLRDSVYEFVSWQHGGAKAQSLQVPAQNTAYIANYRAKSPEQLPFHSSPVSLPGTLEAEDFDRGGQDVAYSDLSSGNAGGAYRQNEQVDIEPCGEGGFNIGYVETGEWLEYAVNIAKAGRYNVAVRVAAIDAGKTFHLELNGKAITGAIQVPATGGFQAWQTVLVQTGQLSAGASTLRMVMEAADFNINYLLFSYIDDNTPPTIPGQKTPFLGRALSIPGKIEAENFDKGGADVAYYDNSPGNAGRDYRPGEDVDIEWCTAGGANIGYVAKGEWLEYSIDIVQAGRYVVACHLATPGTGKTFHLELNGQNITGPIAVPTTGGYQAWQTVSVLTQELPAGPGILRMVMDASDFNINYLVFQTAASVQRNASLAKDENSEFVLYPNPAQNRITVAGIPADEELAIIHASTGQVTITRARGHQIDISGLLPGVYIVEFRNGDWLVQRRFVKY